MIPAALTGFATGLSLILAIGAQNAFVLRQGLLRQHVLALVLLCALSDMILIAAGVAGFGAVVARYPALPLVMTWGGAVFLLVYGALRLRAAWIGRETLEPARGGRGLRATLAVGAGLTWLNPHVYLDTVGLIGVISTDFAPGAERLSFGAGAALASVVFFFSLGYGAAALAPVMRSSRAWRLLDLAVGLTMWAIALALVARF